jgi:hypothetical protein
MFPVALINVRFKLSYIIIFLWGAFLTAYKTPLVVSPTPAATSRDIFGEEKFEFDKIVLSLLQSSLSAQTQGVSIQSAPQAVVHIGKAWSDAYASPVPLSPSQSQALRTLGVNSDSTSDIALQASGFGGIDPTTNEFAYCFSDLWMAMTVDE